ncbi:hypothetical protein ACOMHN_057698 [Nucella lapillus]
MLPVLFALLPNKSQATYTILFQIASRLCHERSMPFHPTIIQTDFEQAVLQACRIVFPQSSLRGCFFHFSQSIWRKVQNLGLTTAYRDDPEVRDIVRLLAVMPIVPEDQLDEAWISIHAAAPCNKPGVGDLLNYMVHTWMGDYPVFNRQLWNQYNNLGEESVRTNNHLESFHSSFRKAFRNPHPNIFVLISELKKRQKATEISVSQLNRGAAPPPKKKRNIGKEKTILRLKEQFDAGARPLMSYMKAMGITVKLA